MWYIRLVNRVLFLSIVIILDNYAQDFVCDRPGVPPGVGYYRHPQRCDKFVQCDAFGQPAEHNCSFGQFFDLEALTCMKSQDTDCPYDPCQDEADGVTFTMDNNCNGYWKCLNSKSFAHCCDEDVMNQPASICSGACSDDCPVQQNTNEDDPCNIFESDSKNKQSYRIKHPIFYQKSFPCPKGVQFSEVTCMCTDPIPHVKECRPVAYQSTDGLIKGENDSYVHVSTGDVTFSPASDSFSKQAMSFTGNSQVVIPRLSNADFQSTILIDLYILVNSTSDGFVVEHVISNDFVNPSFSSVGLQVFRSPDQMMLLIATLVVKDEPPRLIFSQIESNVTTRTVFAYNGKNAILYTDDGALQNTFSVPISGNIKNRQSQYFIGIDFTGIVMNFSVYSCLTNFAISLFDDL